MRYSIEKSEKYTKFTLDEDKLDTLIAPNLKTEFISLYQSGTANLILDLSNTKYVDSSGLSALLTAHRQSNQAEGHLVLVGVNDHVMKLLTISKLDSVFVCLPTVEEAVDSVFLHEIERDLKAEGNQ
ncbi:MAG: anti-anti-sigma factor [Flammeovirgaceae bacterium]|jgi:anti-sigma B factor antagonist